MSVSGPCKTLIRKWSVMLEQRPIADVRLNLILDAVSVCALYGGIPY